MADPASADSRFEVNVTSESHFSWLRTRLSAERTLMSAARTAIALIGLGFTIVQFFDRLKSMAGVSPAMTPALTRYLGLAMIGAGSVALAIGVWQYTTFIHYLWRPEFRRIAGTAEAPSHTPTLATAVVILAIGVITFTAVLLRVP
jgi:putative membrane protein